MWERTHRQRACLFKLSAVLTLGDAVYFLPMPVLATALGTIVSSSVLYRRLNGGARNSTRTTDSGGVASSPTYLTRDVQGVGMVIKQGPRAGRTFPAEEETYTDPASGATVRRLTSHPDDDYHLYFTEDGWYDDGQRLLFRSDRSEGDGRDLFSTDLETGLITQITDIEGFRGSTTIDHEACDAYFWVGDTLVRFDLDAFKVIDTLYEVPEGHGGDADVNADGSAVYLAIGEDVDLPGEKRRFDEQLEARPNTKILRVPTDGGESDVLVDVDRWASSHINASPTRPELFMYCEEGPWTLVDHRIHTANAETGETWRVREVPEKSGVGHEYWMQDGERVGYHGSLDPQGRERIDDPEPFMGSARYDNTDHREMDLPDLVYALTHTHANSPEMHVCDGSFTGVPNSLLYRFDEETGEYEGPKKLATVDWRSGGSHPHSRFSPDGDQVLFDSNRHSGSSDLYLVTVPDFEDLPDYEE